MFRLTIETDNYAFADHPPAEIARILAELADQINSREVMPNPGDEGRLFDLNGNGVGTWIFD